MSAGPLHLLQWLHLSDPGKVSEHMNAKHAFKTVQHLHIVCCVYLHVRHGHDRSFSVIVAKFLPCLLVVRKSLVLLLDRHEDQLSCNI